jgi:hypothetical protein
VPRIVTYDDDPAGWVHVQHEPSDECWFIQIPHIDPGRDEPGKQQKSLRRVFLLTWMATLTIAHFMMEALESIDETDELLHRKEICTKVVARYNNEASHFIAEFEKVKEELEEEWKKVKKARNTLSDQERNQIS